MSKQKQSAAPATTKTPQKPAPTPTQEMAVAPEMDSALGLTGATSYQNSAQPLSNPDFSLIQRQMMAGRIGQVQGNGHLLKVATSVTHRETTSLLQRTIETPTLKNSKTDSHHKPGSILVAGIPVHNTAAIGENLVSLRAATWLERRAWLSFFDHYLPRKLLKNYMDDSGKKITLSEQEMIDCNPIVDIRRSRHFRQDLANLRKAGGGSKDISVKGYGGALTNGTLGNFTINFTGTLTVMPDGHWNFSGIMNFYDYWNFDPKPFGSQSGRPIFAEIRVRVAAFGLPGKPFPINSVDVSVSQSSRQPRAAWSGHSPTPVTGTMMRSGLDIAFGVGAGIAGGPDIAGTGGEVGAQSSEDLNPK
jgi:hypothetical protein